MGSVRMEKLVGIVAHDAGGANILASYCRHNPGNYRYILQGPAKSIFYETLSIESEQNLAKFLAECDSFICGTSGSADLERKVIRNARILQKQTKAILDHWVNYRERFEMEGNLVLPDQLIVVDDFAFSIAKGIFPKIPIQRINNLYLEDFLSQYRKVKKDNAYEHRPEILYLSEGFNEYAGMDMNSLENDLSYFKQFLTIKEKYFNDSLVVKVRLHPSEDLDKFDMYKSVCSNILRADPTVDLTLDLINANVVVGIRSMALVLAAVCGIPTFSLLKDATGSGIPIPGIEYLGVLSNFKQGNNRLT